MTDAQHLRKMAAEMLAVSKQTKDKEWSAHLTSRASDLLAHAEAIEAEGKEQTKKPTTGESPA